MIGIQPSRGRGAAIAVLIIVLAMVHIALIGAVGALAQDSLTTSLRVETARAFYAAESGGLVVMKAVTDGTALPADGSTLVIGSETIEFISVPGAPGEAIVEGRSGFARRRLGLLLE